MMLGERIAPQSEVIRAILLEDSPCVVGCPHQVSLSVGCVMTRRLPPPADDTSAAYPPPRRADSRSASVRGNCWACQAGSCGSFGGCCWMCHRSAGGWLAAA